MYGIPRSDFADRGIFCVALSGTKFFLYFFMWDGFHIFLKCFHFLIDFFISFGYTIT